MRIKIVIAVCSRHQTVTGLLVFSRFFSSFFCPADKDSDDSALPSGFEDNEELQNPGKTLQILI